MMIRTRRAVMAVLGVTLLLAGSVPAGAGDREPGSRIDRHLATLTERLDLTEDQQTAIRTILEECDEQTRALREKHRSQEKTDRDAARSERAEIRQACNTRIEAELSEHQIAEFRKMREERPPQKNGRPDRRRR